ncbi:hypothetical protein KQX54_014941 [Cotesia glomerata]|uniref:Uncharacterized protein n=1 Tax=Cotesia glomerata TaxID=32391 RepID=A0AAV7IIB2_COTGL|nr:hypothetical protein KQX54_014941 [Cotesia glomerata]
MTRRVSGLKLNATIRVSKIPNSSLRTLYIPKASYRLQLFRNWTTSKLKLKSKKSESCPHALLMIFSRPKSPTAEIRICKFIQPFEAYPHGFLPSRGCRMRVLSSLFFLRRHPSQQVLQTLFDRPNFDNH